MFTFVIKSINDCFPLNFGLGSTVTNYMLRNLYAQVHIQIE